MADEQLLTKDMLLAQLDALGVEQGMKILVHVSLSKVGCLDYAVDWMCRNRT